MKNKSTTEERFRNKFVHQDEVRGDQYPISEYLTFIEQEKQLVKEAIIKEVEGMKVEELDFELPEDMEFGRARVMDMRSGMNEAFDRVLTTLQAEKELIEKEIGATLVTPNINNLKENK